MQSDGSMENTHFLVHFGPPALWPVAKHPALLPGRKQKWSFITIVITTTVSVSVTIIILVVSAGNSRVTFSWSRAGEAMHCTVS